MLSEGAVLCYVFLSLYLTTAGGKSSSWSLRQSPSTHSVPSCHFHCQAMCGDQGPGARDTLVFIYWRFLSHAQCKQSGWGLFIYIFYALKDVGMRDVSP